MLLNKNNRTAVDQVQRRTQYCGRGSINEATAAAVLGSPTFRVTRLFAVVLFMAASAQAAQMGLVQRVTNDGIVQGWAIDPANPLKEVKVLFYVDAPKEKEGTQLFFDAMAQHDFAARIPPSLGDDSTHHLYVYALVGDQANLLPGSPLSFKFKTQPPARLHIDSPKAKQVVKAGTLQVLYHTSGDRSSFSHVHWQVDRRPEMMDADVTGTIVMPNVQAGTHTLRGVLVVGHHDAVLNTEVTVPFRVNPTKGQPKRVVDFHE